ncbi:hypothetical protein [Salinigranum sp. GCM10025319]|uniref:hypothetical protein n=1 Tax=Salinigranum sp. GCM10025319 TaxID=3252687 RepID=UPI0036168A58
MRSNWWHLVAALPLWILLAGVLLLVGVDLAIVTIFFALAYPVGLFLDVRYVRATCETWKPNRIVYGALGVLVALSMGVLSFLVSPYYLYKRRKHRM